MRQRLTSENRWNGNGFWIVLMILCLVSCSQGSSTVTTEAEITGEIRVSASPDATATPIPATATKSLPSPTKTQPPELPTEKPELPTGTPLPTETSTPTPFPLLTSETYFDGARVTFIDNAGFLITVGDKKILVDALCEYFIQNNDFPQEVLQRAVNGAPPFDQVDLVIATHSHPDHFSADLVRDHLRRNERAVFISSRDAVRKIERVGGDFGERLISINLAPGESVHRSVDGIELEFLHITHGDDSILNLGVVITVDDYTFFHSGDMSVDPMMGEVVRLEDLQAYRLADKEIDLAFLPSYIFLGDNYLTLVEEGVHARYVSPMHYPYRHPPTGINEEFSNVVVFEDILASWVIPPE